MTKDDLKDALAKGKIFYFRDRPAGAHNKGKGTHSNNPETCKACITMMVAAIEYEGKTYAGKSIRHDNDQIRTKIGRSMALGRAIKNALLGNSVDPKTLNALVDASYKGQLPFLKEDWKKFLNFEKHA